MRSPPVSKNKPSLLYGASWVCYHSSKESNGVRKRSMGDSSSWKEEATHPGPWWGLATCPSNLPVSQLSVCLPALYQSILGGLGAPPPGSARSILGCLAALGLRVRSVPCILPRVHSLTTGLLVPFLGCAMLISNLPELQACTGAKRSLATAKRVEKDQAPCKSFSLNCKLQRPRPRLRVGKEDQRREPAVQELVTDVIYVTEWGSGLLHIQ